MNNSQIKRLGKAIDVALDIDINRPFVSKSYQIQLYLVSFLLLIPVLVYLIFFIGSCYFYLTNAISFFPVYNGPSNNLYVALYILGLIAATTVLIFLVRPFLPAKSMEGYVDIDEKQEPIIFHYANVLTKKLGVDTVKKIRINTEVIIDADYQSLKDFYKGHLTLTIGLPLLPILTMKEAVALTVREYSPYVSRRLGWCYFTIRKSRTWFFRIVHNEDGWQNRIEDLTNKYPNPLLKVLLTPAFFGVSLVNNIFIFFLNLAETVSNRIAYDTAYLADELQAQVVGSKNFESFLKHLVKIDQAYHATLEKILSGEVVPDNMSDLIRSFYSKNLLPPDQFIEMARSDQFNSWHLLPSPISRVRKVQSIDIDSQFDMERDFLELFCDYNAIGKTVTGDYYRKHNLEVDKSAADTEINERKSPIPFKKEELILQRFSSGLYRRDIIWELPELAKFIQLPKQKVIPFLTKVITSIRHALPEYNKYIELVDEHEKRKTQYHYYKWLIKNGSKNRPDIETIENLKISIKEFEDKRKNSIESYKKFYGVRVAAAIALGKTSKAYASVQSLASMLVKLSQLQLAVAEAKIKCNTLEKLLTRRAEGEALHQNTISRLTRMLLKMIEDMESTLKHLPVSLLGEYSDIDVLSNHLQLDRLNGEDNERLIADRFREMVHYYEGFNTTISAKLAKFVDVVEKKHQIEPVVTVNLDENVA